MEDNAFQGFEILEDTELLEILKNSQCFENVNVGKADDVSVTQLLTINTQDLLKKPDAIAGQGKRFQDLSSNLDFTF